jgi:hypothetical protein
MSVGAARGGWPKTLGEFGLPETRFPAIFSDTPVPGRSLWFPAKRVIIVQQAVLTRHRPWPRPDPAPGGDS